MNDDSLRNDWRAARKAISALNGTPAAPDTRRATALDRLARRYRVFMAVGFAMTPLSLAWTCGPAFSGPWKLPFALFMTLYFLTAALMDRHLYRGILAIDIQRMPPPEVARRALACRRRHLQFMAALIPFAALLLGFLGWCFSGEPDLLWGMAIGGAVGLAIGLAQLLRFLRDYRTLR